jgi:murein DD-endopeptidase MepM/ murein hydrolase activator NlpD
MRPSALVLAAVLAPTLLFAQAPAGVDGRWEGALGAGAGSLRLVIDITKTADGLLLGTLTSVDQGGVKIPLSSVKPSGDSLRFEVASVGGVYAGLMNADRTRMTGMWTQMGAPAQPLDFVRAAAAGQSQAAAAPPAAPAAPSPFGLPFELTTPARPMPFVGDGKTHLVYELHLTNFGAGELLVTKLEALNGNVPLASFDGATLAGMIRQPGHAAVADSRAIPGGGRAVVFLWITLDAGAPVPTSVRHRVSAGNQVLDGGAVSVVSTQPVVLGPPLRGADWVAGNGPGNESGHRRAMIPLNGHTAIAQRFAIDWVKVGPNGRTFDGDEKDNKTYFAYGNDVLAVADGIVASLKDGIPQNVPGATSRAVPITPETIGGNYIILDIGGGRFAFYAHMQPGSLRVKLGEKVRRGQVIGLLGNSGNSTEPHLHFHVTDGNTPLESEGLPYVIGSWEVMRAANTWERRQNQLPMLNARVRFPDKP